MSNCFEMYSEMVCAFTGRDLARDCLTNACSLFICDELSFDGRPGLVSSRSPSMPSFLKRATQYATARGESAKIRATSLDE